MANEKYCSQPTWVTPILSTAKSTRNKTQSQSRSLHTMKAPDSKIHTILHFNMYAMH